MSNYWVPAVYRAQQPLRLNLHLVFPNFSVGWSCGNYADGLKSSRRGQGCEKLHNSRERQCFCSAGLAKRFPSPPAPYHLGRPIKTTLLPSPFSLFCLLVRLVFHLRSAPFRRENKHRNAGWQGDRRHEGKEQLRAASERASAGSLGPRSPGPGLASQAERAGERRGPSPVRVLRVRSSPRREADNSCSGSPGSLTPRWAREAQASRAFFPPYPR